MELKAPLIEQLNYLEELLRLYQGSFSDRDDDSVDEYEPEAIALAARTLFGISESYGFSELSKRADYLRLRAIEKSAEEAMLWDAYHKEQYKLLDKL